MNALMIKRMSGELSQADAVDVLAWALNTFAPDRLALASSLGAEDQVLTHLLKSQKAPIAIFTIDTGRLYPESMELIQRTESAYSFQYEILRPEAEAVEQMIQEHGEDLFYKCLELRKHCCQVRKIEPLKRRLAGLDAWICGLRREQSVTREGVQKVEWDEAFGLVKINPLAEWSEKMVWDYIRKNRVPHHVLHEQGYPSIGCAPCTRAVRPGEDARSGRWWWENPEHKECGLHARRKEEGR